MTRTTLALLLAAAAEGVHAQGLTAPPPDARPPAAAPEARPSELPPAGAGTRAAPKAPLPHGAILEEVAGVVREVDRRGQRIAVDSGGARVTLSLDRNTMVYTVAGLGTVLDVVPGAHIRAGRNADFLAYWVQVRPPAGAPTPAPPPGQGTGPAGGSAAGAAEAGAAPAPGPDTSTAPPPGAAPTPQVAPGGTPAGASAPSPGR
jgi:hypothetical protein